MASSRRSRYLMSPGASGVICTAVTFGGAAALATSAMVGACTGPAGVLSILWNSQNLISCGTPFSVTTKSLAVSPSMGLPFLSLTLTVSTTSCESAVNLIEGTPAGGCCWASNRGIARSGARAFRMLEPHPQRGLDAAHGIGGIGQPELGAAEGRVPVRIGHVIERVGGVKAQVDVAPVAPGERPAERGIEHELAGAGNGIAARIAPLSGGRRGERRRVQIQARGRGIERSAGIIRPQCAGRAGAGDGGEVHGRERQAGADRDIGGGGPLLEERALPAAQQRAAAEARAAAVLHLHVQQVALVEGGEAALGGEVEPVLRDEHTALAAAAEDAIVDRLGIRIARARREARAQAAAQLELAGFAGGIGARHFIRESDGAGRARIRRAGRVGIGQ